MRKGKREGGAKEGRGDRRVTAVEEEGVKRKRERGGRGREREGEGERQRGRRRYGRREEETKKVVREEEKERVTRQRDSKVVTRMYSAERLAVIR